MSAYSGIIDATPNFVAGGPFDAWDFRQTALGNALPGLFSTSDFTVAQRGTPAMAVTIGRGRAIVDPQAATNQGLYCCRVNLYSNGTSSFDTSTDGAIVWTAADPTNARIDLLCIEVADTDQSGAYTGFKFHVIDGTPNASATHQLETAYWPAIPTGSLPIAAIRVPATATTLTTANITNLVPITNGWQREPALSTATVETTTSATYARLATPDFIFAYVPAGAKVRLEYRALWKISVASGTQGVAAFINGTQSKAGALSGAPASAEFNQTSLGTLLSALSTKNDGTSTVTATAANFTTAAGTVADMTDVATGQLVGISASSTTHTGGSPFDLFGLAAGWYVFEIKFKTSANTLTVQSRHLWAEVVG